MNIIGNKIVHIKTMEIYERRCIMDRIRNFIVVEGIVQGVGFRPFVYNLAKTFGLKGWVNNNSEGVHIEVEGFEEDIDKFMQALENNPPPLSRIGKITMKAYKVLNYSNFVIKESKQSLDKITLISPDIATSRNKCSS